MAATITTTASDIRTILLAWAQQQQKVASTDPTAAEEQHRCPIIDFRPLDQFLLQRLSTAVHIPSNNISGHCFWLPDKNEPFGIVLPADSDLPVEDMPSLPTFLHSRQWSHVMWCLRDGPALWVVAKELGLWEGGPEEGFTKSFLLQRFAFRGCPLLTQEINRIERMLMWQQESHQTQQTKRQQQQQKSHQPQPAQEQQQEEAACGQEQQQEEEACGQEQQSVAGTSYVQSTVDDDDELQGAYEFRCLEPGCGSGRNIVWLSARHAARKLAGKNSHISLITRRDDEIYDHQDLDVRWSVIGIDSWYAALTRTQQLCQETLIPPETAEFWYASIDPETGLLAPLTLSTTTKHAAGVDQNTHIRWAGQEDLKKGHWHMILCVRFLERAFLQHIPDLIAPGGFLLYSTFLDMEGTRKFGRPKGSNHLLQRHELLSLFGPSQGFEVLRDDVMWCRDGRELSLFVARKSP